MGLCESYNKNKNQDDLKKSSESMEIIDSMPIAKSELDNLYCYESATCKIKFQILKNGELKDGLGSGFFCEINHDNIPIKKALFTNNHVLDKTRIKDNDKIEIEYLQKKEYIKMTKDRKKITNKKFDYTCIEIFDTDNIKTFFCIDNSFFSNKNTLINKEIFILQYPNGILSFSFGQITGIKNDIITHNANTKEGSSGSPLIKRYNNNLILGIHIGSDVINHKTINIATSFDIILEDIASRILNNNHFGDSMWIDNQSNEYRNKINLIYEKRKKNLKSNNIFGENFVNNNKDNIKLIINGQESPLVENYELKEGINIIQMIILNKLINLECMFKECVSLTNIDELKFLDTREIENFSFLFYECKSLKNLNALENWDVSNGNNFKCMFFGCISLINLNGLENWDVSNSENFKSMFCGCRLIKSLNELENWDVSKGKDFSRMFQRCKSLTSLKGLKRWNVSKGEYFSFMFEGCKLTSLDGLEYWDVSNASKYRAFESMFSDTKTLKDIKAIDNWNFSYGDYVKYLFANESYNNSIYSDISEYSN